MLCNNDKAKQFLCIPTCLCSIAYNRRDLCIWLSPFVSALNPFVTRLSPFPAFFFTLLIMHAKQNLNPLLQQQHDYSVQVHYIFVCAEPKYFPMHIGIFYCLKRRFSYKWTVMSSANSSSIRTLNKHRSSLRLRFNTLPFPTLLRRNGHISVNRSVGVGILLCRPQAQQLCTDHHGVGLDIQTNMSQTSSFQIRNFVSRTASLLVTSQK